MRVLLVAPNDGCSNLYIRRAFEELGHKVREFDYRLSWELRGPDGMNETFLFLAQGADLTLVLKGERINHNILSRIHPCVLWNFDSWYSVEPWLLEHASNVDLFLTPSGGLVKLYNKQGIKAHYLPEAADPEVHHPVEVTEEECKTYGSDVVFIGTVLDVVDRAIWLKEIGEKFDLKIWGSFPDPLTRRWHTGMRADGDAGHNKVVSASKIILDKTRTPNINGAISARVYRTLAAKGFLLMRDIEGLEDQFRPGIHLETFRTNRECLDKIADYLPKVSTRQAIAQAGYEEVLKKHTWIRRVEELLKLI